MFAYIARHAWAHTRDADRWPDDSQRPLTEEGSDRYRRMISILVDRGFQPRQIATSEFIRCVQTAEIISELVPGTPPVQPLPQLGPGAEPADLIEWIQSQPSGEDVCLVGHAPDVSHIVGDLLAHETIDETHLRFAKGAIAAVEDLSDFQHAMGQLHWHVTAKVLGV